MADELNKKKPDLGSGSSSVSAPKPAQQPKPNPVSAPKPAANNFSAPKQKPAPAPQPKPVPAPKANPAPVSTPKVNPAPVSAPKKAWDKNNNPGSAVTTKELENWTRNHLGKDPQLSKEFIDKTVNGLHLNSKQADFYKKKMQEEYERAKASELFGTDLSKNQGPKHHYDSLSKELDGGELVNIDAGLLPYDYGFQTSGHEDLAVDARKNPETGKYEVHMYPETENGPVSGYEPGENEPTYEFDSFDDLKAFIENGYKESEEQQRAKASKLYGTDLNKPEDSNDYQDLKSRFDKGWIGRHTIDAFEKLGLEIPNSLNTEDGRGLATMALYAERYNKSLEDVAKTYSEASKYYRKQLLDFWRQKIDDWRPNQ